jgi:hypothetical protein
LTRLEVERYIREEIGLSDERKAFLCQLVNKHGNHLLSIFTWLKNLNLLVSNSFDSLSPSARIEIIQMLIRGAGNRRGNPLFISLLEIFFRQSYAGSSGSKDFPSPFLVQILKKSRQDDRIEGRPFWAELFLVCCSHPLDGSTVEDYLPGLHHEEDLVRCRVLNFLYNFFKEKSLPAVLSEVIRTDRPPSLFFSGTLGHLLSLHPHIHWAENLNLDSLDAGRWEKKDARWLLLHQLLGSIRRHQFLAIHQTEISWYGGAQQLNLISRKRYPGLRKERLDAITSESKWR